MASGKSSVAENAREKNAPDKRDVILQQAIHVFSESGFRGTDVQVIADQAGVGKGTVYRYFGNKEDLFWATTMEVAQRLRRAILRAADCQSSFAGKIREAAIAYGRFFDDHPECVEVFVQDRAEFRGVGPETHRQFHERMIQEFVAMTDEAVAAGELRAVDGARLVHSIGALCFGTIVHDCYKWDDHPMADRIRYAVDILLDGIRIKPDGQARDEEPR
jgi:AcrR family transcriptional regulator